MVPASEKVFSPRLLNETPEILFREKTRVNENTVFTMYIKQLKEKARVDNDQILRPVDSILGVPNLVDSESQPCEDTKQMFKEVNEQLYSVRPVNLTPLYIAMGTILPILFIVKTFFDIRQHKSKLRYIEEWERLHLGKDGIRNEEYIEYPEEKETPYPKLLESSVD